MYFVSDGDLRDCRLFYVCTVDPSCSNFLCYKLFGCLTNGVRFHILGRVRPRLGALWMELFLGAVAM